MDMLYQISYLFMFFFIASSIGYVCEVVYCSIDENRFAWNRGFLLGPYLPIYGVGTLTIIYALQKYYEDPLALFLLTIIICSVIEYMTSWIMEKLFKVRWWDYSSRKFNIDGRVCLLNSSLFGLAGIVVVYGVYPLFTITFSHIPHIIMIISALICFSIFFTDLIVTVCTLISIRITLDDIEEARDSTENTRDKVVKRIKKHATLYKLLLRAFPYIDGVNENNFRELRKLVEGVKKTIAVGEKVVNETKRAVDYSKDKVVSGTKKAMDTTIEKVEKTKEQTKKLLTNTTEELKKIKK